VIEVVSMAVMIQERLVESELVCGTSSGPMFVFGTVYLGTIAFSVGYGVWRLMYYVFSKDKTRAGQ
jgi:hypothetical protein